MEDLCSSTHCNVCLVLQTDSIHKQKADITFKKFKKLFTCSNCQLVRYCGIDHQKIDWPLHSSFCRAVRKLKQEHGDIEHPLQIIKHYNQRLKNKNELEEIILLIKYKLQKVLKRPLKRHENDLVSFPVICGVCFRWQNLTEICHLCYAQAYCCKDHLEADSKQHKIVCHLLSLYYCSYKVLKSLEHKSIQPVNCNKIDMLQYDLKEFIEKMFSLKISSKSYNDLKEYQTFSFASQFSCIASVCYCLERIPEMTKLNSKTFKLYIIGATVEASLWFLKIHTKLFFLQQPKYELLELYFIGLELQGGTIEKELHYQLNKRNYTVKYYYYTEYLENYIQRQNIEQDSSFIVAFNCGFSEYAFGKNLLVQDTWAKALNALLKLSNIPIMFTSFTHLEGEYDYTTVKSHISETRYLINRLELIKNPYSEFRPLRNWYLNDKEQFYYRNGYIQCIEVSCS